MTPIRVVVADDEKLIRDSLRLILNMEEGIEIVCVADCGHEAVNIAEREHADLVLMDLRMASSNGLHGTLAMRHRVPECKVLILTGYAQDGTVLDAIRAGAQGAILKDTTVQDLICAIHRVISGEVVLAPEIMQCLVHWFRCQTAFDNMVPVTSREVEVIQGAISGMTNKEIGEMLYITEGSVKSHLNRVFSKLHIRRRTELTIWAHKHGLLHDLDEPN